VKRLEKSVLVSEGEVEQLKQYIRRDMLEIHAVPITEVENTNLIVQKVVELADPLMTFEKSEISISHRLPSRQGQIPPIIVKFVRRDMRDKIYKMRRGFKTILLLSPLFLCYFIQKQPYFNSIIIFHQKKEPYFINDLFYFIPIFIDNRNKIAYFNTISRASGKK
jgi:hypothetical protein